MGRLGAVTCRAGESASPKFLRRLEFPRKTGGFLLSHGLKVLAFLKGTVALDFFAHSFVSKISEDLKKKIVKHILLMSGEQFF